MTGRKRSIPVFARYWLFQLPGIFLAVLALSVLVHWGLITRGMAGVLLGCWVLKDLAMYPFLRVGYEQFGRPAGADALVGAVGVVREPLGSEREGWVRLGPELWRAVSAGAGDVPAGARVRVVSVQGLVLSVEPEEA